MSYDPRIKFPKFKRSVEKAWPEDYDLKKYKIDAARIASLARKEFFPRQTTKTMKPHWRSWISEIEKGAKIPAKFQYFKEFDEYTIGDMRKGEGKEAYPFAFHYRLHRYHRPEDLELADMFDRCIFKRPLREIDGPVFLYEPDEIILLKPNAPISPPRYKTKKGVDDILAKDSADGIWLDPHNHHSIPKYKRVKEEARLSKFIGLPGPLRIFPVIGPSGAGKTRLISEWMEPYVLKASDGKWEAGFVVSDDNPKARDPKPWNKWEIKRDTLIVIDYTHAFGDVVKAIVKKARQQNNFKIRLIVIDHVMPKFIHDDFFWRELGGGHAPTLNGIRTLIEQPIEIHAEKDNSALLKHVIAKSASVGNDTKWKISDSPVVEASRQLDRMGQEQGDFDAVRHPLFAALMGQAIRESSGKTIDFSTWSRRDLITYYFSSRDRLPWTGWDGIADKEDKVDQGLLIGALVSAATLRRGLQIVDVEKYLPKNNADIVQQANRIVSHDSIHTIKPFLPDILGEALLLKFLGCFEDEEVKCVEDKNKIYTNFISILSSSRIEDVDNISNNFRETIFRLARNLANDDPERLDVIRSWEALVFFLDPERFPKNTALRFAVSCSIADVMEQITEVIDRLQTKQLKFVADEALIDAETNKSLVLRFEYLNASFERHFSLADVEKASESKGLINMTLVMCTFFEFAQPNSIEARSCALRSIFNNFVTKHEGKLAVIHLLAFEGRLKVLKSVIKFLDEDIDGLIYGGVTALMLASGNGHLTTVKFLHKSGAKVDATAEDGVTALIGASQNGHLATVEFLHKSGAKVDAATEHGVTALIGASVNGHLAIVKFLHKKGTKIDAAMKDGTTALMLASLQGHLTTIKFLLKSGAKVDAATKNGVTALMRASFHGFLAIVKFLYKNGAKVDAETENGETALMFASANGHLATVKFLHKNGAKVDAATKDGITTLMIAGCDGNLPVVEYLYRNGASIEDAMNEIKRRQVLGLNKITREWSYF